MTIPGRAIAGGGKGWTTVDPKEAGFAGNIGALLDKAIAEKRIWNLHSLVIAHRGRIAFERYSPGVDESWGRPLGRVEFKPETLHDLRSVTKSIVALLYGIALAEGLVPPPEAPLMPLFPEYGDLALIPPLARWRVEHVLTMSMGIYWDETTVPYSDPTNSEIAMERAPDRYSYVLGRPVVMEPGRVWNYNGGATALLGRILTRGTGRSLNDYGREKLFGPLGLGPTEWIKGDDGVESAASGLRMSARDLARIGDVVLNGGRFEGRVVLPADWIARITTPSIQADEFRQFGFHWYMGHFGFTTPTRPAWDRGRLERYWAAFGNGGQRLFLLPGLRLSIAIHAGNYSTPDQWVPPERVMREVVLPALA